MTPPQSPQPESIPRVPLTARIDADLHLGMREAADALDWSTNSVLNEAVREFLQRRQDNTSRVDRPDGPDLVELRPLSTPGRHRVVVDGFPVPHLTAAYLGADEVRDSNLPSTGDAFGWAVLTIDDRYQTKAMQWGEFWPMAWFLANAMAVAAGYTSHGPNANRLNPHGPPEEALDFAAWAERGWVLADASGSGGHTYELNFTFRLPAMDDADLRAHAIRSHLVRLIDGQGGRDVCTRTVALRPLQAETPPADLAEGDPVEIVVNGCPVRVMDEPIPFHLIAAMGNRAARDARITYHLDRPGAALQAELHRGGTVRPLDGMVFSVMDAE